MSGYTPGPWELSETALMVIGGRAKSENPRINGTRAYIADCAVSSAYRESGEAAANAQLIAAAPDLLAACATVLEEIGHWPTPDAELGLANSWARFDLEKLARINSVLEAAIEKAVGV